MVADIVSTLDGIDPPAGLGRKVVAAVAAPGHRCTWVPVPDSKIHSRCAECGSVTLTELVQTQPAAKLAPLSHDDEQDAPDWASEYLDLQAAASYGFPFGGDVVDCGRHE